MAELAPGLSVSSFVPKGQMFVGDMRALGMPGPARIYGLNPADWERVPPAEREWILDRFTRGDAERGQRELDRFLAAEPDHTDGRREG